MKARCRVCGGDAVVERPDLPILQATCTACGWHFTHHGLAAAHLVRMTEQFAFYPGGEHLSKRIGIGNGSIACGDEQLDAVGWPRKASPLRTFIKSFFGVELETRRS